MARTNRTLAKRPRSKTYGLLRYPPATHNTIKRINNKANTKIKRAMQKEEYLSGFIVC